MSQEQVLRFLCAHRGAWSTKQIAQMINLGQGSTQANLRKLARQGYIDIVVLRDNKRRHIRYKVKEQWENRY